MLGLFSLVIRFIFFLFAYFLVLSALAQRTYSGNIIDSQDKGFLEGVKVQSISSGEEVLSNTRGYFSISAFLGDTLVFSFPGFVSQRQALSSEFFLMIELQDKARFLPTFEVEGNNYSYSFKDGRLTIRDENEAKEPSRKGEVITRPLDNGDGTGGIGISGPISYFTKKARLAREYERKKEWLARRKGYYQIIESDAVRAELMEEFQLTRESWDQLVIRFNQFHQEHEFLDWSEARVRKSLEEFIRIETSFLN
ncbi:carboxypeptidase-like regulatory domain-containing protein [Algoriphagus marincola]|uniref:Carboxypeptidase-like regulatory domain-containing protein n=1 Tax=Algoriphagus marincola TaxID=264027 RepID=A0ABS7N1W7_9BACT|nr:carboxypeptidase-like regulatory domain-containing protein [Algoriphagus marincola]MBY5950312.1 carboxypeptidase-like regulatory domain-containing protein [Algoriphagus marincola]